MSWVGYKACHWLLTPPSNGCLDVPRALLAPEETHLEGWHEGANVCPEHSFRRKMIPVTGGLICRNGLSAASPLEILVSLSRRDAPWNLKLLERAPHSKLQNTV